MPTVPEKEGFFQHWEDVDLSNIRKNYKIHAVYTPWTVTIANSSDPMPLLLAEASFYPEVTVHIQEKELVSVPNGYQMVKTYQYQIQDPENRPLPEDVKLHILAKGADVVGVVRDGTVDVVAATKDGDYLIFESGISGEILLMKSKPKWGLLIIAGVGMVVAILVVKKKRGWQTAKAIQ